jgi:hypothetical protein
MKRTLLLCRCIVQKVRARYSVFLFLLWDSLLNGASLEYVDVGHRWSPLWAGTAADIGYYVKTLKKKK